MQNSCPILILYDILYFLAEHVSYNWLFFFNCPLLTSLEDKLHLKQAKMSTLVLVSAVSWECRSMAGIGQVPPKA
jgi:hypothetical protein